jgi:hypothetical protein
MKSALRSKRAMHKKTPTYGAFALSVVHSHYIIKNGSKGTVLLLPNMQQGNRPQCIALRTVSFLGDVLLV